ncbi:MAG: DUF4760 domain-containing protein [Candidatus Eremiobacteraeota bacterium]|nr:DUF4760 domain-containing protein [Candidatus Eremiobacteraeota bacterium]MBV8367049.1 DUF4760 domain-containing protein [Candidatus Eremiobacteraeota bacterium]
MQLRHARGSKQIAALAELQDQPQTAKFEAAEHTVRTELEAKLKDPEFRYQCSHRAARTPETRLFMSKINTVGNFYENMGLLMKSGLVDRDLLLDTWSGQIPATWERLSPFRILTPQDWLSNHAKGA